MIIDANVTVTDPEGNFDGGTLTVSGLLAEDIVSVNNQGTGAGQVGFAGGTITYGGVAIGTATGGAGADLVVTFNQNATTAAVEAVTENLTYANGSDAPTASRALTITVADDIQAKTPILDAHTGADNPFAGIDARPRGTRTAFGDLDGDGDLDLVAGGNDGTLYFYENAGSATQPVLQRADRGGESLRRHRCRRLQLAGAGRSRRRRRPRPRGRRRQDGTLSYFENTGSRLSPGLHGADGRSEPLRRHRHGRRQHPCLRRHRRRWRSRSRRRRDRLKQRRDDQLLREHGLRSHCRVTRSVPEATIPSMA